MTVTVSNSAGKLMFKGKTNAAGSFTTKSLTPGNYVVQFNSDSSKGGPYALVVAAGKKKVVADSVPASKFRTGGVAMRVEVSKAVSLTGQIAPAGQTTLASNESGSNGNARVKYINGKKYVWVTNEIDSNLGGRWVDANSPEGRSNQILLKQDQIQKLQEEGNPTALTGAKIYPGTHP